jgi:N-acetyl-anhydromuramyl-L-alanine amidase AmpD
VSAVLPPLVQRHSPNQSSRHGTKIDLLVWHETAGAYAGSVSWLCNPAADASAHLVVREDGLEATQLVPLSAKAWHAAAFNPRSVGVEHANVTAKGYATQHQLEVSARIFGWLCLHLNVPPRWARGGVGPGVCRHMDLGAAGGGHTQCGPDLTGWLRFLELLHAEIARGGFRPDWAHYA